MAEHACPVWLGYVLVSPLRKLLQDPQKIFEPYVKGGMTALDVGCAMGYFSLPLARLVGPNGKVICVDFQERMLTSLERRARRAGLADRIETRPCAQDSLGLDSLGRVADFALLFAMVHEVPDSQRLFSDVCKVLKPSAQVLLGEPKGHVRAAAFAKTVAIAEQCGLQVVGEPRIALSHAVLLANK